MSDRLHNFTAEYTAALGAYLADPGEGALKDAYELGRKAIAQHLGALDIVWIHQMALDSASASDTEKAPSPHPAKLAWKFLLESLAAIELTHRGYRDTVAALSQRALDLADANRRLEAEIWDRKEVEGLLRKRDHQLTAAQKVADRTARQRDEDTRQFATRVQRAQEEERRRIARELHDDICQQLTALRLHINLLEDDLPPLNTADRKYMQSAKSQLDHIIADVRRMSANLRPTALDLFGLDTTLRILCEQTQKMYGLRVEFEADGLAGRKYDSEVEIALYRIAQEVVSNVTKHSHASEMTVILSRPDGAIALVVQDNGKGFLYHAQPQPTSATNGYGLVSMRERAELLGGTFELTSAPGEGTVVRITIPVNPV